MPALNHIPNRLSAAQVRTFIDFDGNGGEVGEGSSQAELQSKGVAALWHLLGTLGYAYLGDEVGMGKTRQAMGVIATRFLSEPDSHVVIVCPGRTLQEQWVREWDTFIRRCYRPRDNRLVSALTGAPLQTPLLHDRLRDFAEALLLNEGRIHLLRYSSFSRPIWFDKKTQEPQALFEIYCKCLKKIGIADPSEDEVAIIERFRSDQVSPEDERRVELTAKLNEAYARRVGQLLKAREIHLAVFDEAQYLRHTYNRQNTNIRHVFRTHVRQWLFLSATPLHTGPDDIRSLDNYLCVSSEPSDDKRRQCAACTEPPQRCARIVHRLGSRGGQEKDVVDILKEFLVRRPRFYQDMGGSRYQKVHYRAYRRVGISASSDPLFAFTMALVQKRLVAALDGRNNKFRQGECSSFESLSSSLKRELEDDDGNKSKPEIEVIEGDRPDETPDRSLIDDLNASFCAAVWGHGSVHGLSQSRCDMPHAKLWETAVRLFEKNLAAGSNRKALVFVRRLDTVDELLGLLLARFQREVDERISAWRELLAAWDPELLREGALWEPGHFYDSRDKEDDVILTEEETEHAEEPAGETFVVASDLPYFAALKRKSQAGQERGMLVSFHARLLEAVRLSSNPFHGFLLTRDPMTAIEDDQVETWEEAERDWHRFLEVVLGVKQAALKSEESRYAWLFLDHLGHSDSDLFWKLAVLKRCLLMSLRQTDFIVDLYIMNRFIQQAGGERRGTLVDKFLWFLNEERAEPLPEILERYACNWRQKLRRWIDHFDLIVDKSLRSEDTTTWATMMGKVNRTFARMSPVFGRSGRLNDANAVPQFKFPTHPNVLVCTDVLKEGVDMHLFCDEVIHYGVAWTSGDLEQRIGRVDRFGSLISRKIRRHGPGEEEERHPLPRLQVEFPYLDGTLDKYQVERVIREKVRSDLRMDLGKRRGEIGEISLDDLCTTESRIFAAGQGNAESHIFFPKDVPGDDEEESRVFVDAQEEVVTQFRQWRESIGTERSAPEVYHFPALGAVAVRCNVESSSENRFLREIRSRKKGVRLKQEEFLFRYDVDTTGDGRVGVLPVPLPSPTQILRSETMVGVHSLPHSTAFVFSSEWNTLVKKVAIENPFAIEELRRQSVLLEHVTGFWLLRTPVFSVGQEETFGGGDFDEWILQQNEMLERKENGHRKWGFWFKEVEIVWFAVFVKEEGGEQETHFLERLAECVGSVGDRVQHLYSAADNEVAWAYRSRAVFPSFPELGERAMTNLMGHEGRVRVMMRRGELERCGQFLAGVQAWFESAFREVLNALYGDVPEDERGLQVSTITYCHDGILRVVATGQERFSLQAFLHLKGEGGEDGVIPGPRMIWELGVSTAISGPKPKIQLSDWDLLPHRASDGWKGLISADCAVYSRVDKYRFLALYHSPELWDKNHGALLHAWGEASRRMRNGDSSFAWCRKLFVNATNRVVEETAVAEAVRHVVFAHNENVVD